ncbi:MAG TPA: iron-containing alcohol dehydrogenase [Candidatus Dormibacteraeota bacterium]|nr:iron-containing alcohol dehydrogenase [Candidatus Dormibacteraeota bacterium]
MDTMDTGASFDHQPRTRIVFGPGALDRLGELARQLGATRALLVTDQGIVAAGHTARAIASLQNAKVEVVIFDKARENPTTQCVADCLALASPASVNIIVGLGGGSSMDTAKGCNFLLTNGGRMQDYRGVGKASKPMLPMIAIPTTAGTGSECQSAALIVDEQTHQKMACLDPKAAPRLAILDPALTISQPARVTACTGIDALAHALESAVTTKRNVISWMYSREAFRLCATSFPQVLMNPQALEARGQMLLGAALAGLAIENSMLGAAHAAANPLTAHYGVVHGQAVGMMLPAVIRFNATELAAQKTYTDLAATIDSHSANGMLAESLAQRVEAMLALAQLPTSLEQCGVERGKLPLLAQEAAGQWTATFNPKPLKSEEFFALYEQAFDR